MLFRSGHVQPYFVGSAAIGCCYNTGFHTFMFSLTVLLLAVPYHSGADAASLPSGGNGAEQPLRGLLFVAKQAVKKTAETPIFRFVGMGRGVLGLLNRFGGSLSGGCGGLCGFKAVLEVDRKSTRLNSSH